MISPEYERHEAIGFLEAIEQLAEDDGLVLSREYLQVIHEGRTVRYVPVHYEGLDAITEMGQLPPDGRLVTSEFQGAATRILDNNEARPGSTYPLLTVTNDEAEEQSVTEVMDVAEMIESFNLPIYAYPDRYATSGEVLSIDMAPIIKKMAALAGIDSGRAIVIDEVEARPVEEIIHVRESHFSSRPDQVSVHNEPAIDRRGEAMLSLLQMDMAQAFFTHRHRIHDGIDEYIEVELRVATQPDIQTTLISLIDLAQLHHMNLFYSRGMTLIDEEGATFTLVDDAYSLRFGLATEKTLGMAVYNAYLAALEVFKRIE